MSVAEKRKVKGVCSTKAPMVPASVTHTGGSLPRSTVAAKSRSEKSPCGSVARMRKNTVAAVGTCASVPLSTPVAALRVMPSGSAPPVRA